MYGDVMKKFFFLLLALTATNIKALEANIECQTDNISINNKINCSFIIKNSDKIKIKNVSFENNGNLLDIKSNFNIETTDQYYSINTNSDSEKIIIANFNYFMSKNNEEIAINNIEVKTNNDLLTIPSTYTKLAINNAAYLDAIYINNQPINLMRDIYDYEIDLYNRPYYLEIKALASGKNKAKNEIQLIKFISGKVISLEVSNDNDTEIYNLTINYNNKEVKSNIEIKEIPFYFNASKTYYYLEVENNIDKLTINDGVYNLNNGKNTIDIISDGITYNFVINRLKSKEKVNLNFNLKSLKIGNTYLNLKEDVYEYNYTNDKMQVVTLETTQDYDITYNDNLILINIYNARAEKLSYKINIFSEVEKVEVKDYDNTKTKIIFAIFLATFLLISIIVLKKYKKEHIH